MQRIASLDYLRGIMASSVMLYHFVTFIYADVGAGHPLGRLGIYAVAMFYVLSGLSLAIIYRDRMSSLRDVAAYAVKRIFRIFPLFWLVVTAAVLLRLAIAATQGASYSPDAVRLFLNYSLLFGFVRPDAYLTTGAWSIGNEMVFYALFPFIVYVGLRSKPGLVLVGAGFLAVYALFAWFFFDPSRPLERQWATYINPYNQAFLFVAGVMIGFFVRPGRSGVLVMVMLAGLALAFFLFPGSGNLINIVSGSNRIVLSLLCVAIVGVLYFSNVEFRNPAGRAMSFLGDVSYSVYLIHPLVIMSLQLVANRAGLTLSAPAALAWLLVIGIPLTLMLSYLSYRLLERPMLRLGGRLAAKFRTGGASALTGRLQG